MYRLLPVSLLYSFLACALGQPVAANSLTPSQAQALVQQTLATELRSSQDTSHPMRYRLRKTSPRLTATKELIETRDGDVARLVSLFDRPLSPVDEQKEQARLDALARNPNRQQHRKQSEEADTAIVLKLLRIMPQAFLYDYAGAGIGPTGSVEKFTFHPDPRFHPSDIETQALTAMKGDLWVDASQKRVTKLEGHLQQDTEYGWGILGKLDKGGWIVFDQADIGGHQWRIVRFQMKMEVRVLFRNKSFDTLEEMTGYAPVTAGMDYQQAIQLLLSPAGNAQWASRQGL